MATKIHKGLLAECPVCSGYQPERKFKRKRTGIADTSARRQANLELGEDPTRIQKDAVFMKFGLIDPIIDRNVKKPNWKSEVVWQREMKQFVQDTAGMVPRQRFQESRRGYTPRTASTPYPSRQLRQTRNWQNLNRQMPLSPPTEFRNSPRGS
jgi:hypothetical protein